MSHLIQALSRRPPAPEPPPAAPASDASSKGAFALILGEALPEQDAGGEVRSSKPVPSSDSETDDSKDGNPLLWADLSLALTPVPTETAPAPAEDKGTLALSSTAPESTALAGSGLLDAAKAGEGLDAAALASSLQAATAASQRDAATPKPHAQWAFNAPASNEIAASLATPLSSALESGLPASTPTAPLGLTAVVTQKLLSQTGFSERKLDGSVVQLEPLKLGADLASDPAIEVALPPGAADRFADAFAEGMATRLDWMAEQKIGRAEIELHPAELGAIEVQLEMDGTHVRAEFTASSAEAKHLLESSLPRLRDLFQAQGLSLAQANVGQHDGQPKSQTGATAEPLWRDGAARVDEAVSSEPALRAPRLHPGSRVLSEYA